MCCWKQHCVVRLPPKCHLLVGFQVSLAGLVAPEEGREHRRIDTVAGHRDARLVAEERRLQDAAVQTVARLRRDPHEAPRLATESEDVLGPELRVIEGRKDAA